MTTPTTKLERHARKEIRVERAGLVRRIRDAEKAFKRIDWERARATSDERRAWEKFERAETSGRKVDDARAKYEEVAKADEVAGRRLLGAGETLVRLRIELRKFDETEDQRVTRMVELAEARERSVTALLDYNELQKEERDMATDTKKGSKKNGTGKVAATRAAILDVLAKSGEPMKSVDVIKAVLAKRGFTASKGTVSAQLSRAAKEDGNPFVQVERGVYALAKTSTPKAKVEKKETEAKGTRRARTAKEVAPAIRSSIEANSTLIEKAVELTPSESDPKPAPKAKKEVAKK